MAKLKIKGFDELASQFYAAEKGAVGAMKQGVYVGADIVIKSFKREIEGLPEVKEGTFPRRNHPVNGLTPLQKQGLIEGLGIPKMDEKGGTIQTHIGFHGFNKVKRNGSNGQRNSTIARLTITGTATRRKNDFSSRAIKNAKAEAEKAMKEKMENSIKQFFD